MVLLVLLLLAEPLQVALGLLQPPLPQVLQLALVEEWADSLRALHPLLSLAHTTGLQQAAQHHLQAVSLAANPV